MLDPQQRVFLECAWEALGARAATTARSPGRIGVYGGSADTGHLAGFALSAAPAGSVRLAAAVASGIDFLTSRVAYRARDCAGPAVTVQTACSTSLVAVYHVAAQALLGGECDSPWPAASPSVPPRPSRSTTATTMASSRTTAAAGRSNRGGTGTVTANGAGIVALKRLADALADGDRSTRSVGSAVNNDASVKIGFTAPGVTVRPR